MTDEQFHDLKASIDSLIKTENQYNLPDKRFTKWKRHLVATNTSLKSLDFAKVEAELKPMRDALKKDLAKVK